MYFWCHDEHFYAMTWFWRYVKNVLDVMTCFWRQIPIFYIMTIFLKSWIFFDELFDVMTYFGHLDELVYVMTYFWRYDVFLKLWHTFRRHEVFSTSCDVIFNVVILEISSKTKCLIVLKLWNRTSYKILDWWHNILSRRQIILRSKFMRILKRVLRD